MCIRDSLKDDQIKAVATNGGVVCINFYSGFISKEYDQVQKTLLLEKDKLRLSMANVPVPDSIYILKKWEQMYDLSLIHI